MTAKALFDAGDLSGAIDAALAAVKSQPTDTSARWFLCELLCFTADWERIDRQLETLGQQDTTTPVQLSVESFRRLVRAAVAREEVYREGRTPSFIREPSDELTKHLQAIVDLRAGEAAGAATALAAAETERPTYSGSCDGQAFSDFRDLDDLTASFFEVLSSGGEYHWIPFDQVHRIKFNPPRRARDLLWRPAHLELHSGESLDVYVPTVYAETAGGTDDALRLGRGTEWLDTEKGPVRGVGLRMYLVGEVDKAILELDEISFQTDA